MIFEIIRKYWVLVSLILILCTMMVGCTQDQEGGDVDNDMNLEVSSNNYSVTNIELNGNQATVNGSGAVMKENNLVIQSSGVYEIAGELTNGRIMIDSSDTNEVTIRLNGVRISNQNGAAFVEKSSAGVVLLLAEETTNYFENTNSSQADTNDEDTNEENLESQGGILCKNNLTIEGTGDLEVYSKTGDGIKSKGVLSVVTGSIKVESLEHGLTGNDGMQILGGTIEISCEKDGLHSKETIEFANADLNIKASNEGIEAKKIWIKSGNIILNAKDDGLNAAADSQSNSECEIVFDGGTIAIYADGDGIDSNGSVEMNGGTVYVYGPTTNGNGALDYGIEFTMNGGTMVAMGSSGMMQSISDTSKQYGITQVFGEGEDSIQKGDIIKIQDGNETILEIVAQKETAAIVLSTPELEDGKEYVIVVGDKQYKVTAQKDVVNHSMEGGMRPQRREAVADF